MLFGLFGLVGFTLGLSLLGGEYLLGFSVAVGFLFGLEGFVFVSVSSTADAYGLFGFSCSLLVLLDEP